jgi:transposase
VTGPTTCGPGSPGIPQLTWSLSWRRCGPAPALRSVYATRIALRELCRRARFLDGQLKRLDEFVVPLVTGRAPGLLALYGVGPDTAAMLLVAAGDHPGRLRSEAAWAHLCATPPLRILRKGHPPTPQPGGDRQAKPRPLQGQTTPSTGS